jgi:hypothetical protein
MLRKSAYHCHRLSFRDCALVQSIAREGRKKTVAGNNSRKQFKEAMKYRRSGKSKIKYEHGMIDGLRDLLESIESIDEIVSIIPGVIKPVRGSGSGIRLEVKYPTQTGIKLLAKSSTSVQEVFIVTNAADILIEKLKTVG